MTSKSKQVFFAIAAVVGLCVTWYFNIVFMSQTGGFSLSEFLDATHANAAASSISNDLLVVTIVFLVWSFTEAKRLRMRNWWLYIPLTFAIAIAVSYPVFMLMRERAMDRSKS